MLAMHVSHQVGLEADIWFRPMPDRKLSMSDRERMMSTVLVRKDRLDVDPKTWRPADLNILRFVAKQPEVLRIFVNPAIKKAICRETSGLRPWLGKIRPEYGHISHFHVRLVCPPGQPLCRNQFAPPKRADCGKSLAWWFSPQVLHPKPNPHYKPRPPITLAQLPRACRAVLGAK
ncbi:MAG TPA: penicillin-insensitive murein endopeptidase, partial [Beijerinckiaceae bacterium]|nr:penicillin-insensitive murein endopeptidase [Beijerinckiaceae bacterium]